MRAGGAAGRVQVELEVCRWTLTHTPPGVQDRSLGGAGPTSHRYTCRGAELLGSRLLLEPPHLSLTWRLNQSSVRSRLKVLNTSL